MLCGYSYFILIHLRGEFYIILLNRKHLEALPSYYI